MSAAHTPGPWFLFGNGHCVGGPFNGADAQTAGVAMCSMARRTTEENDANARLIVAAPTLLAELQHAHALLLLALKHMPDEQKWKFAADSEAAGIGTEGATRYHERRAAIAAATGSAA